MRLCKRLCCFFLIACAVGLMALGLRAGIAVTLDPTVSTRKSFDEYFALPYSGANFRAYSLFWHAVGRCYLKGSAGTAICDAYKKLETTMPDRRFVYGETGWNNGGRFWPHRTHREG